MWQLRTRLATKGLWVQELGSHTPRDTRKIPQAEAQMVNVFLRANTSPRGSRGKEDADCLCTQERGHSLPSWRACLLQQVHSALARPPLSLNVGSCPWYFPRCSVLVSRGERVGYKWMDKQGRAGGSLRLGSSHRVFLSRVVSEPEHLGTEG